MPFEVTASYECFARSFGRSTDLRLDRKTAWMGCDLGLAAPNEYEREGIGRGGAPMQNLFETRGGRVSGRARYASVGVDSIRVLVLAGEDTENEEENEIDMNDRNWKRRHRSKLWRRRRARSFFFFHRFRLFVFHRFFFFIPF